MDARSSLMPLFNTIDSRSAGGFAEFLSEDVEFRFGNGPTLQGRQAVFEAIDGFFGTIAGLKHDISKVWSTSDSCVVEGQVTYTRNDDSTVAIPFCNVMRFDDNRPGLFSAYRIYIDLAPLFAS
jgi:hypothetical protein